MPSLATANAPTSLEQLAVLLEHDNKVKVAGTCIYLISAELSGVDIDGVLRGKIMSKSKFLSACRATSFGFCSVIFGWDSMFPLRRGMKTEVQCMMQHILRSYWSRTEETGFEICWL